FTEPMDIRSVEANFHVKPAVAGDFVWSGNELFFTPRHSLHYGTTYSISVGAGARDRSGRKLSRAFHGGFTTQSEHLLYLGTQGAERDRLVLASVDGRRETIGSEGVTGFSLSFDRSLVVYVKRGAPGERPDEIWLLSLADDSTQRVFRRPDWTISQPHFSPDGRYIVFLATNVMLCPKYYGCFRDRTGPVIYLLDLRSRKAGAFQARGDVPLTDFIAFSPSGQIAFTDLGSALTLANPDGSHIVHIPYQGNSPVFAGFSSGGDRAAFVGQTPDSSGGDILVYQNQTSGYVDVSRGIYDSSTPAFSSSGKEVAYAAYRGELGIEPVYGINVYDFAGRTTKRLTAERDWSDWSPAWSGDDRYIAFVRSQPQESMYMGAGDVWVMKSNGTDARPLGDVGTSPAWVS
ncbi:MAG: Ig-like domain-containing protein, partial [Chloroflexi bacterium]|nr:Ig-like domain-containing protein [Chloroflexota bacterium]